MPVIDCTLIADGPSDRVLEQILHWLLIKLQPNCEYNFSFRLPRDIPKAHRKPLLKSISYLLKASPCDLLFVHRDAEGDNRQIRVTEIHDALAEISDPPPHVCVVPVRMTEAWLLFDENAIRRAAGNPNGTVALQLPQLRTIEQNSEPKSILYKLLTDACELQGRRLSQFKPHKQIYRVVDNIEDFSPLQILSAFQALEADLKKTLVSI